MSDLFVCILVFVVVMGGMLFLSIYSIDTTDFFGACRVFMQIIGVIFGIPLGICVIVYTLIGIRNVLVSIGDVLVSISKSMPESRQAKCEERKAAREARKAKRKGHISTSETAKPKVYRYGVGPHMLDKERLQRRKAWSDKQRIESEMIELITQQDKSSCPNERNELSWKIDALNRQRKRMVSHE